MFHPAWNPPSRGAYGVGDWYRWDGNCLILNIRVHPRATNDGFGEVLSGRIRLRITAPPVDGKANAHITKLFSKLFGVPLRQIELVSGATARDKTLRIDSPARLPATIVDPR